MYHPVSVRAQVLLGVADAINPREPPPTCRGFILMLEDMYICPRKIDYPSSMIEVKIGQNNSPDILRFISQLDDLARCGFV
jgi:hypothetical protein